MRVGTRGNVLIDPSSNQIKCGDSVVKVKNPVRPSRILDGMLALESTSPSLGESEVTWRVYEAKDFARPTTYIADGVTTRLE